MEKLIIDDIEIFLIRKRIKNMNLSVKATGEVRISVPLRMDEKIINDFIKSKIPWIKKHQERFGAREPKAQKKYVSEEMHYFLGREYLLNIIYIDKNPSKVLVRDGKYIDLYIKKETTIYQREKLIKEWYRGELKKIVPPLINKWEKTMKVHVAEFGIKQMKTRWGTCNIRDCRIWLNLELAKKPLICLEYIIIHEMVHLLERDHNEIFKAHMDYFLPNWREIESLLNH